MNPTPATMLTTAHAGSAVVDRLCRLFPWLALAYFAGQATLRVVVGGCLGFDDAEQVIMGQTWAWGYGPQPPLYTWIVLSLNSIVDDLPLTLTLVRNGLLWLTVVLAWALARRISRSPAAALVGGLSLWLIPWISWESQHSHTHTLAVVAAAALTLWAFVGVVETRRAFDYAVLALAIALGTVSKFNYLLLPPALLVAAITMTRYRSAVLSWRMGLCLLAVAALVAPAILWTASHPEIITARTHKFRLGDGWSAEGALSGLATFASALAALVLPALAVMAFVFFRRRDPTPLPAANDSVRLLWRCALLQLAAALATALAFAASNVNARWILPFCFFLPLLLAVRWSPLLTAPRVRSFAGVVALVALGLLIALPARTILGANIKRPVPETYPFSAAAAELTRRHPIARCTILGRHLQVVGNLLLNIPGATAVTPEYLHLAVARRRPVLIVWPVGPGAGVPPELADLYQVLYGSPVPDLPIQSLTIPIPHSTDGKLMLQYILVPE